MSLDKRINGYLTNFSKESDRVGESAVKGLKIGAGIGAGLGAISGGLVGAAKGSPIAMIGLGGLGAINSAIGFGATGAVVGALLGLIKKSDVKDDKYYVIKNDKVMNEFSDRDRANQYASVHDAYVNKGTTLKEKVGK